VTLPRDIFKVLGAPLTREDEVRHVIPSIFSAKVQTDQHRRDLRFCHELAKRLGCPLLTARLPCGTGEFRYRCFLPDLTGFAAPSCTGPNYQQSTSDSVGLNAPVFTSRLLLPSPAFFHVAERGGFEPPVLFWSTHDFQSCTFNRSVTSPSVIHLSRLGRHNARTNKITTAGFCFPQS
jgi:hypothetical protein